MSSREAAIRIAKASDIPALQKLGTELMRSDRRFDPPVEEYWYETAGGEKYLRENMKGPDHVCLIAEVHGLPVGYLLGNIVPLETWRPIKRADLENLVVTPAYRNQGIGGDLLKAFKEWCNQKGAKRIKLTTKAANKDAIAFYARHGFVPLSLLMEADLLES